MAGLTQIIDERIEQIRRERAELDEFRSKLLLKEAELNERVSEAESGITPMQDRKEGLQKEIREAENELKRLHAERDKFIEGFGEEMDGIHADKTAESLSQSEKLRDAVTLLLKSKRELEHEIEVLRETHGGLTEQINSLEVQAVEEKGVVLQRLRGERDAEIKELNLAHSMAVAELENEKKSIELEIAAIKQRKNIEQSRVEAEVSRYRQTQMAEIDMIKEQALVEAEKERAKLADSLRAEERNKLNEMLAQRREWDKELSILRMEKQRVVDETKLLDYEYEKTKSDILIKTEKARIDLKNELEAARAEFYVKLKETEQTHALELRKKQAEANSQLLDESTTLENNIKDLETKRKLLLKDFDILSEKYEQERIRADADAQVYRLEKMTEIDNIRMTKLAEIESAREERIAALEQNYIERSALFESIRDERMQAGEQALQQARTELESLVAMHRRLSLEIEEMRAAHTRIKAENDTVMKIAKIEHGIEIERMTDEKFAELELRIAERTAASEELLDKISEERASIEDGLAAEVAETNAKLAEIRRGIAIIEPEYNALREEKLAEIKAATIAATDEMTAAKIKRMQELEEYFIKYKDDRLAGIERDLNAQTAGNLRKVEELTKLNVDYDKRMTELRELSLTVEAEKQNIDFLKERYQSEVTQLKKLLKAETDSKREELALITETKDQQIRLLQDQLLAYTEYDAEMSLSKLKYTDAVT